MGKPTRDRSWFDGRFAVSASDADRMEVVLIKGIQAEAYPEEMKNLVAKNITSHRSRRELGVRKSPLTSLNPFVDRWGVIMASSVTLRDTVSRLISWGDLETHTNQP